MKLIPPLILAGFLTAASTTAVDGAPAPAEAYFPAEFATEVSCPGALPMKMAIMNAFTNAWYSGHLRAAGEPSLYAARSAMTAGEQTVRFTYLPSFGPPVIVRIAFSASGEARLIAKQLSGAGGYAPGIIARQVDRQLSAGETARVQKLLADPTLTPPPAPNCGPPGNDGSQWIIERIDARGYHFRDEWSPRKGVVLTFGLAMLELTGWKGANAG